MELGRPHDRCPMAPVRASSLSSRWTRSIYVSGLFMLGFAQRSPGVDPPNGFAQKTQMFGLEAWGRSVRQLESVQS